MRIVLVTALVALTAPFANAQCVTESGDRQAHVIELYTSEGCSSCPPADQWLAALPQDANLVPLAFHVDYWDSSSWKDRFDDPRFTARQHALAAQSHSNIVYTPEVALDGRELRNWSGSKLPSADAAPMKLVLTVQPGPALHVHLDATGEKADAGSYETFFAVTQHGLSSQVRGGENNGSLLRHEHVVRAFAGPLAIDRADATLRVPADVDRAHAQVVAFVQRRDDGVIVDAVSQSLASCASPSSL